MDNTSTEIEVINSSEYCTDLSNHFPNIPVVARSLLHNASIAFKEIEHKLYTAPSFLEVVKAIVPDEVFQAVLTKKQKQQLANGALELLTKKDGSLMATLRDPKTKEFVSTIALEKVKLSPEITQAMSNYASQMQMAQIAEQIHFVQVAIEEVRQGQEYDRLAAAYSCQQKLLQAMVINNPHLKETALLRIAADAEDSRNRLMFIQSRKATFIHNQPEGFWEKMFFGEKKEKIDATMAELRDSLAAVNMVSLVEAMAYHELKEPEAAQLSLQYYAEYIQKTYLQTPGFVNRLDMIDPSPEHYWSQALPRIQETIKELPCSKSTLQIGGNRDGTNQV